MANKRRLTIEIIGDPKSVVRAFDSADSAAGRFGRGALNAGKTAAKGIGLFVGSLTAGAALAAPAILRIGGDLDGIRVKSEAVFEGSLPMVRKWAEENARFMGMTTDRAVGAAAALGDLLKPMGFTSEEAATMSTEMLNLSGALSAWSNGQKTAAEVSDILAKAMLGEREQLKTLGISITEAEVKARLLANGQEHLTGTALQQARALATQQLIMEKSTDAQNAWNNGQQDGAKAAMAQQASIENIKESLVKILFPVLEAALPKIEAFADWISEEVPPRLEVLVAWIKENWPQIRATIETVIEVVTEKIGAFVAWAQRVWAKWGDEILAVIDAVWPAIRTMIDGTLTTIKGIVDVFAGLLSGDWSRLWDGILGIVEGVWTLILGRIQFFLGLVKVSLQLAWAGIKAVAQSAWDGIADFFGEVWDRIVAYVQDGAQLVVDVVWGIPDKIGSVAVGMFAGLVDGFRSAVNTIIGYWNNLSLTLGGGSYDPLGKFGPTVSVPSFTISTPNIPLFHEGGTVGRDGILPFSGLRNDEVLAILQAGETVLTRGQSASVGSALRGQAGAVVNIRVDATPGTDRASLGRELAEMIEDYLRQGGTLGSLTSAEVA